MKLEPLVIVEPELTAIMMPFGPRGIPSPPNTPRSIIVTNQRPESRS